MFRHSQRSLKDLFRVQPTATYGMNYCDTSVYELRVDIAIVDFSKSNTKLQISQILCSLEWNSLIFYRKRESVD